MQVPETPQEQREYLRATLVGMDSVAALLGAEAVREAVAMCLAIIDAPGELDRVALAPAMCTTYERLSELFRAGAEETSGALQELLLEQAALAEEDAREMQEVIHRLCITPPN